MTLEDNNSEKRFRIKIEADGRCNKSIIRRLDDDDTTDYLSKWMLLYLDCKWNTKNKSKETVAY